jgi:hypothetical protein
MTNLLIRPGKIEDLPFIYSTWLRAYKYSSDFARSISSEVYYKFHHLLIERIITRSAQVLVACESENLDVVFGYLIAEGPVIHFAYVKKPFRDLGIGTSLLKMYGKMPQYVSHLTKDGKKFLEAHPTVRYNPYVV